MEKIKLDFSNTNEVGEPQCWLDLSDNTSIEVTLEKYETASEVSKFYTVRHHCSNKDFDDGYYRKTCGVINNFVCDTIDEVQEILSEIIGNKKIVIA